jgi:hypothetical protein
MTLLNILTTIEKEAVRMVLIKLINSIFKFACFEQKKYVNNMLIVYMCAETATFAVTLFCLFVSSLRPFPI